MRLLLLLSLLPFLVGAQSTTGLNAHYPFEGNPGDATGDANNLGVPVGAVDYDCGVIGQAVSFQTPADFIRIPGGSSNNVNRVFNDEDLSLTFYFKSTATTGRQVLLSKRDTSCATPRYLTITYAAASRTLETTLRDGAIDVLLTHPITEAQCWQYVGLVRDATTVRLYVNGNPVAEQGTSARLNIDNAGDLLIGASDCPDQDGEGFTGLIDELKIYSRALSRSEVGEGYVFPDRILTPPTQLFLGQSLTVDLNSNCGTSFSWTPTTGVETPDQAEPTITPARAGRRVFTVRIGDDQSSCVARDSLVLTVIDPDELDCAEVFIPKAFTPNGVGPEQNETFGIANPFAVPELLSFEVYDRHGALVFQTQDPFVGWDGNFRGQPVNPGVMLWRLVYRCEEQEVVRSGSVTILR